MKLYMESQTENSDYIFQFTTRAVSHDQACDKVWNYYARKKAMFPGCAELERVSSYTKKPADWKGTKHLIFSRDSRSFKVEDVK